MNFKHITHNTTFLGRNGYLLVAAAWLFTLSFIVDNYWSGNSTTKAVQRAVQSNIQKNEEKSNAFINDTVVINNLIKDAYTEKKLDNIVDKDYFIFIYKLSANAVPAPVFWNTQIIMPDSSVLNNKDGDKLQLLANGWYVVTNKPYKYNSDDYVIVTLLPVKWNYYVENKYLQNSFIAIHDFQNEYDVSLAPTKAEVKDAKGRHLFFIKQIKKVVKTYDNIISLWMRILASVLVLFFIHKLAKYYYEKKGFWYSFFVLAAPVLLLRTLSYFLPIPLDFRQLELFNSEVYGSNAVLRSLGDLLINSLLFIWLVLFIRFHFRFSYSDFKLTARPKRYFVVGSISLMMIGITVVCGNIVRSLVFDSQISFDVINFFTLNIYSVIGFIVLSCVATGYFFLIQVFFNPLKAIIQSNWFAFYLSIAATGLVLITFRVHSTHVAFDLCLLAWLLLFIFLLNKDMLALQAYNLISSRFIFWLFFFSVSITAAIVIQNRKKEMEQRKHYAENLASKADPAGEIIISTVLSNFNNREISPIFHEFKTKNGNKFLKDSLIRENFSSYLNRYDTRLYTFDSSENALYNEDSTNFNALNAIIQTQGKPTDIPDLYYYDISYDRFNYISKKEITDSVGKTLGYLFIISRPKKYKSDALYPELFSKGSANSIESSSVYALAIYNNNRLNTSNDDYPFPTSIDSSSLTYNGFRIVNKNGYEELWYRANADKVVVIARQNNLFVESITLFAYLFCSFLLVTVIFNLLNRLVGGKLRSANFKSFWQFTIRNQVHGTIISISIFSFLVIGVTTILFFISRYHNNNREKLSRTIHVMENEIRNSIDTMSASEKEMMNFDSLSNGKLEATINRVASIHAADINLYSLSGDLEVSSLPLPYTKGIVSKKMDPVAYFHLNKLKDVQFAKEQQIGTLNYLSNYVPVRDEKGKEYAYLNIPYFESQNNLQDEISNFLVTIINLNAFIFLVAGIIALFITNRITSSFSLISDKMKEVNLEKTNEEIVWTRKDEIGELVNEYNKMVQKLDVSAKLLAKSEREGAWREMARQVAHEIKNPLTPMKLNLQYLQNAIDNNSPEVKNISLYVANILLEQIEHLSQIASDFAQFANIGNAKNQFFNINRTLLNVASLFSTNEKLEIKNNLYNSELLIEADKTQVNRLFTNLLQNAVQSVPPTREPVIEIASKPTDNNLVIVSIKDNGNGIERSMYNKIFTPNFTTKTSGTGLGLAMCKGIVEKLNGRIWFETEEGKWTTFFVELPLIKE